MFNWFLNFYMPGKRIPRGRLGFTLVELVMVLVIIGLISAIIVPRFASQREQASISSTKANLESLRTALALYFADNNAYPADPAFAELHDGSAPNGRVYIRAIPPETITNPPTNAINQSAGAAPGGGGWHWDTTNEELYVNLLGNDANGQPYADY